MRDEQLLEARGIVVPELEREITDHLRNTGRYSRCAYEPVVRREERMIGADRNQIASRVGAGELESRGRGVRTVLGELDHLRGGDAGEKGFGALDFTRTRPGEVRPALQLVTYGPHYRRKCVAETY